MNLNDQASTDELRLMIKSLTERTDAGPILGAILGNACTVDPEHTRNVLIREIRRWYTGELTN